MSRPYTFNPTAIPCKHCGQMFMPHHHNQIHCSKKCQWSRWLHCQVCNARFSGSSGAKYCSYECERAAYQSRYKMVTKMCEQCGQEFTFKSTGPVNDAKRRFCSTTCSATWRMSRPGVKGQFDQWIGEARHNQVWTEERRARASAYVKANPIVSTPEIKEKLLKSLQGRTFLSRGGNGELTKPQKLLAERLGLSDYMEYVIKTAPVKDQFPSLPHHYKVDIANPSIKLAIEVDGSTHRQPRWKFLDRRKTEVLEALGWSVLRFWNQEVLDNLETCAAKVEQFMTSK